MRARDYYYILYGEHIKPASQHTGPGVCFWLICLWMPAFCMWGSTSRGGVILLSRVVCESSLFKKWAARFILYMRLLCFTWCVCLSACAHVCVTDWRAHRRKWAQLLCIPLALWYICQIHVRAEGKVNEITSWERANLSFPRFFFWLMLDWHITACGALVYS